MQIHLVPDAARVLRHAWSVRFLLLSWLFSGFETFFSYFVDHPPFRRGLFASLAMLTTVLAAYFRFVSQKEFRDAVE